MFALIGSVVALFIAQLLITKAFDAFGVSWGPENLPVSLEQQAAMVATTFDAGVIGSAVAVAIHGSAPWIALMLMLVLGLSIDTYAALYPLASLPLWFRVAFVISVPLQIGVGVLLGRRVLLRSRGSVSS